MQALEKGMWVRVVNPDTRYTGQVGQVRLSFIAGTSQFYMVDLDPLSTKTHSLPFQHDELEILDSD